MFNDHGFRDRVSLSGVNSINWARIMAQIVYYFSSALSLGAPDRPVSFTVPTGNFGDIFAGYAAKRMGLPIERLIIATNDNDILARTLRQRRIPHQGRRRDDIAVDGHPGFVELRAPAVRGGRPRCRDGAPLHERAEAVRRLHHRSADTRQDPSRIRCRPRHGRGSRRRDPLDARSQRLSARPAHSRGQCMSRAGNAGDATPMVVLGTAHPAKFPAAVEAASGVSPALPAWLGRLDGRRGKIHGTSIRP